MIPCIVGLTARAYRATFLSTPDQAAGLGKRHLVRDVLLGECRGKPLSCS